jgi:hypothetical protein
MKNLKKVFDVNKSIKKKILLFLIFICILLLIGILGLLDCKFLHIFCISCKDQSDDNTYTIISCSSNLLILFLEGLLFGLLVLLLSICFCLCLMRYKKKIYIDETQFELIQKD